MGGVCRLHENTVPFVDCGVHGGSWNQSPADTETYLNVTKLGSEGRRDNRKPWKFLLKVFYLQWATFPRVKRAQGPGLVNSESWVPYL